jgi:hypothetical protein
LKPFEIYMDASATQLGAVRAQDNRPIAFFSRNLSKMQAMAIVETLKEFRGMLLGMLLKSLLTTRISKEML